VACPRAAAARRLTLLFRAGRLELQQEPRPPAR
jgi:hypothetical protein